MKKIAIPVFLLLSWAGYGQVAADSLGRQEGGQKDTAFIWHYEDYATGGYAGISLQQAYDYARSLGRQPEEIVVAVIDSGIDTAHVDLAPNLWTNPREIPYNHVDDDGNGKVDDVHGWNFIGGADGYCINGETLELTRLYARLKKKFDGRDAYDNDPEYQEYIKLKEAYKKERKLARKKLDYYIRMLKNYDYVKEHLQSYYGRTDFTPEELKEKYSTAGKDMKNLLDFWQWVVENDISRADLEGQKQYYADAIAKRYNTKYNPRAAVGDNPADIRDTLYGNNILKNKGSGHGTSVSGVIGAVRDNGIGIDGIAPRVKIMPLVVVPGGDERDKDVALAIFYAVRNGARIINCSFGKDYSPYKSFVDSAVRYAEAHQVLIIHAAGNDGKNIDVGANYPTKMLDHPPGTASNWIEVGASNQHADKNLPASFSNYGRKVDVFAPGVKIRCTAMKNKYEYSDGTSLAAPVTTGVAALVLSYFPQLTAQQLKDVVVNSGVYYGRKKVIRPQVYDSFSDEKKPRKKKTRFKKLSASGRVVNAYLALKYARQKYGDDK